MWGSHGIIILCGNSKRNQGAATLRLTPTNTSWLTTYLALCQSAISRFTMFHYVSLCFTMFHYVSLCFTMFHYVSLCFTMFHYVSLLLTVNSLDWCWIVFTIVCSSRTHEIPHLSVSIQCNPSSMRCLASAIYQHSQIPLPNIYIYTYIHTYIHIFMSQSCFPVARLGLQNIQIDAKN